MDFVDRDVKCLDCGAMFVFSAGEQAFFKDKGFVNDPKHCKSCKALRGKGSTTNGRNTGQMLGMWLRYNRAI